MLDNIQKFLKGEWFKKNQKTLFILVGIVLFVLILIYTPKSKRSTVIPFVSLGVLLLDHLAGLDLFGQQVT